MRRITFCSYVCGMSEKTFSEKIMIWEPLARYEKTLIYDESSMRTVADFINCIKDEASSFLGEYGLENLSYERLYVSMPDLMIGMQENKNLSDLFEFFATDYINFAYFVVAGGASIHCPGYIFKVHPNEEIHRNTPHVHVCRDDISVRYSLENLERFKKDKAPREYIRDEKKVILPFLKKNQEKLLGYWNYYMNGLIPPAEDETGRQFYAES